MEQLEESQPVVEPAAPDAAVVHEDKPTANPLLAQLCAKLSSCYLKIGWVAKTRENTEQGYKFASAEEIYDQVRAALADSKLALLPVGILNIQRTRNTYIAGDVEKPTKGFRYSADMPFRLVDCETGYYVEIGWLGECMEYQDKAIPKIITTATKYLLRCLFMIPTGEDPDANSPSPEDQPEPQAPPQPVPQQTRRQQAATTETKKEPAEQNQEPAPAESVAKKAIETADKYAKFRDICKERGVDPFTTAKTAEEEGVKSITELELYATGIPKTSNPNQELINDIGGLAKQVGWVGSNLQSYVKELLGRDVDSMSMLSEGELVKVRDGMLQVAEAAKSTTEPEPAAVASTPEAPVPEAHSPAPQAKKGKAAAKAD